MKRPSLTVYLLTAFFLSAVAYAAFDAIVTSDEEQLEELADAFTDSPPVARVDGVLSWIDVDREPLRIRATELDERFEEGAGLDLAGTVQDALEPFSDDELDVVQRSVHVEGDLGRVAVRVRQGGRVHDATFTLRRNGQGWLISDLRVL